MDWLWQLGLALGRPPVAPEAVGAAERPGRPAGGAARRRTGRRSGRPAADCSSRAMEGRRSQRAWRVRRQRDWRVSQPARRKDWRAWKWRRDWKVTRWRTVTAAGAG